MPTLLKIKTSSKGTSSLLLLSPQRLQRNFPLPLGGGLGLAPKGAGVQVSWKVRSRTRDPKRAKASVRVRRPCCVWTQKQGCGRSVFKPRNLRPWGRWRLVLPAHQTVRRRSPAATRGFSCSVLTTSEIPSFQITPLTFERLMC